MDSVWTDCRGPRQVDYAGERHGWDGCHGRTGHCGCRRRWLSREENLSEEKATAFQGLKQAELKTSRAWALVDLFREFYEQQTPQQGRAFFQECVCLGVALPIDPDG